jgi:transcriptional regulator with XRE-family HTH domain
MTSHKNWRRKKNYVVEHFLPACVLWDEARRRGITHAELAQGLGKSSYTVQSTLAGKTNMTWDRAFWLASLLGMQRVDLVLGVDQLQDRLARELDDLHIYKEFPSEPPPAGERLVMAYHIQDRLCGMGWEKVFPEDAVTSDMVWRARLRKGMSRWTAAQAFGVTEGTISHWEKANVPARRWEQAHEVYGRYLR